MRTIKALIWWATKRNRHCRHFCPTCFWFRNEQCQTDVFRELIAKDSNFGKKILHNSLYGMCLSSKQIRRLTDLMNVNEEEN